MDYAIDLLIPLVLLGITLPVAFVALTNEAVADVAPDERGLASGIFETANHLFGGAVGVALYAAIVAASGYGAGFAVGAGLALLGILVTRIPNVTSPNVSSTKSSLTWQAKRK